MGRYDAEVLDIGDSGSERAARYDAWFATPLGRVMDACEARAVLGLAAPQPGERALDAGCGTGIYTRRLAELGATVTGVDLNPEMLAAAGLKAPSATLVVGDVTALPFAEDTFDLALAVTLLCFVEHPRRGVAELVRVTRPGGRIVSPSSIGTAFGPPGGESRAGEAPRLGAMPTSSLPASLRHSCSVRARTTCGAPQRRTCRPAPQRGCVSGRPPTSAERGGWGASAPPSASHAER